MSEPLRAPFPWFGGKSRAAHLVWAAFGDVANYVEPFAGSLAVLLGRPTAPRIETVNDIDATISNFWRALQAAPDALAQWADWPVNEVDLHARHIWIVERLEKLKADLIADPHHFDVQLAGYWVWGLCQWIGSGWCTPQEWRDTRGGKTGTRDPREAPNTRRPAMVSNGVHAITPGGCGRKLKRKTWLSRAKCTACSKRRQKENESPRLKQLRQQARRYRILLHIAGFEDKDFADLVIAVKASDLCFRKEPEDRLAKIDWRNEPAASRKNKRKKRGAGDAEARVQ